MKRNFYLIFEGIDRVGKTTTRKLVEKERNVKDTGIDRFIGSSIVYGKIYKRYSKKEFEKLYNDEYLFSTTFDTILIFLYSSVDITIKRIEESGHEKIDKKLLTETLKEFNNYYEKSSFKNKIKIDTGKYSQKEVVEKILNYLKKIEKNI